MIGEHELLFAQGYRIPKILEEAQTLYPSEGRDYHYYAFIIGNVNPNTSRLNNTAHQNQDKFQIVPFQPEQITPTNRIYVPEQISTKETGRIPSIGDIALIVTEGHWFGNRITACLYPPIHAEDNKPEQ